MHETRVLIIDDHTLFRSGIKLLLERQAGFAVVGEAGNALDGVKRAKKTQARCHFVGLAYAGYERFASDRFVA